MAHPIGTRVRVLPPFAGSFPGEYVTVEPPPLEEGADPYPPALNWLEGIEGAWDDDHLEVA